MAEWDYQDGMKPGDRVDVVLPGDLLCIEDHGVIGTPKFLACVRMRHDHIMCDVKRLRSQGWKPRCYEDRCATPNSKLYRTHPTHGSCCTCQKCGWGYDECICRFFEEPCLSCPYRGDSKGGAEESPGMSVEEMTDIARRSGLGGFD